MESTEEILDLIDVINSETEKCCSEILQLTDKFAQKYRELLPQMPYNINVIDELHINENGHSRILTKLLQFKNQDGKYEILESFLKYIVNEMHREEFANINIKKPIITQEKCRIDLWVRDSTYALIFENKIYNANDQDAQIHRYIERTKEEKYNNKNYEENQIYVIYLPQYDKEPEEQSWGIYKERFKDRYANLSFRNCIIPWLKNYVIPNIRQKDKLLLSAIVQYIDYLEGFFSLRTINNKINMALQELISEKIFSGKETTKERILILENKMKDISKLQNEMQNMKEKYIDEFASEWLSNIQKNNQAQFADKWEIKKSIGDYTICLGIENQKPWWGVCCEAKYTDDLRNAIEEKIVSNMNVEKKNIDKKSNNYLLWSFTSFENGESRFKKLIEIFSK